MGGAIGGLVADVDRRDVAARTAAAMFTGAAAVVFTTLPWLSAGRDRVVWAGAAGLAVLAAGIFLVLPWRRWPDRVLLATPALALVLLAAAGVMAPSGVGPYSGFYLLVFGWIGLHQPPRTSLLVLPAAVVSWVIAGTGDGAQPIADLLVAAPCWILIAETMSRCLDRQRRSRQMLKDIFAATRRLVATESEEGAADTAAGVVQELVDADVVEVMVADGPCSTRFVNQGERNSPAPLGSMSIDASVEESAARRCAASGELLFFPDVRDAPGISHRLVATLAARSAMFVPLPGEGGHLGAIAVIWHKPRTRLSSGLVEGVEMIVAETGRALERTRAVARLAAEADTDALTGLANRRALERALGALQPGDAVVVIDLDRFKGVNDNVGHDGGDEVLRRLARCLASVAQPADTVARLGGDEFAWVMGGPRDPTEAVGQLRRQWEATWPPATFSAGIALHGDPATLGGTLKAADAALYEAKLAGRNRTVHAGAEPEAIAVV